MTATEYITSNPWEIGEEKRVIFDRSSKGILKRVHSRWWEYKSDITSQTRQFNYNQLHAFKILD